MKQFFYLSILAIVALSGCTEGFKKTTDALEYKIIADGKGPKIQYGNFMQMQIRNWYNDGKKDTILGNSESSLPMVQMFDSVSTPLVYYNILRNLRKGDSVVIRILSDSVMKKNPNPNALPPFIKKGHYFYTGIKLLNIFENGAQADSAQKASMREAAIKDSIKSITQLKDDCKKIEDFLAKNKITAVKAPLGTYVEIIQPGTGLKIDSSVTVKVNYTGRTFAGKTFDSNTDPSFQHMQPFDVPMTQDRGQGVVKGWTDGLSVLSKGAKARFYIPSPLGWGAQGTGPDIKANEITIFDIDVLDVLTKEQAAAQAEIERKKMEAMQKHFTDSVKNVQRLDSLKNKAVK